MTPSTPTPRPLWGWTTPARAWLNGFGALVALGLIAGSRPPAGPPAPPPRLIVDPNTAPPEVLGALPKLGPALVGRLVAARDEASFRSVDDLDARVRGIGPATLAALRPYLRIERPGRGTPPSVAAVDLATRGIRVARSP
jgi:competence protein ComEA